jgi:uncharacterized BrkB/YihY/UPF0761 family membrane protein
MKKHIRPTSRKPLSRLAVTSFVLSLIPSVLLFSALTTASIILHTASKLAVFWIMLGTIIASTVIVIVSIIFGMSAIIKISMNNLRGNNLAIAGIIISTVMFIIIILGTIITFVRY